DALTYGRRRAEVLSGQANGAVLLVLGLIVIYEAISRLIPPPEVAGLAVTIVAAGRGGGDRRRGWGEGEGQSSQAEHRGQLSAHPDRLVCLHRDTHRWHRDPRHRLRPSGR